MKQYDIIVIGAGGGAKIISPASKKGLKIAAIEKEAIGGTCLNRGCIPSKMLIHAADVAEEIAGARKFSLEVNTDYPVHFEELITRVSNTVDTTASNIVPAYHDNPNIDFYPHEARFVSDKVVEVNGEHLTADKIFIAVGSRPHIPNIPGLAGTPYMTSREALRNTTLPKKLLVIGGGYIATELGYFYASMGSDVTFIARSELLKHEDKDVRKEITRMFADKYTLYQGVETTAVSYEHGTFHVTIRDNDGAEGVLTADALMVATGVTPNTDSLGLEQTAITTNNGGFIEVNDRLETAVPGVYAMGDVVGNYLFRHSVNFEGEYLMDVLFDNPRDEAIQYPPMPHAVFTNPQIAGVGKTEDELIADGTPYVVGMNPYKKSAMGDALLIDHGFVKLLFAKEDTRLLGAHIIGPEASDMIHMCIAYITMGATLSDMLSMIYIHPALPENVRNACRNARTAFAAL